MRYRFKGMIRETGRVVEGHVEAPNETVAYDVMGDNGIVCETLREDPRLGDYTGYLGDVAPNDEVSSAVDSALDTAAKEVDFDALSNRFKGKKVWVLDRNKIRDRVKAVVLKTVRESSSDDASQDQTLAKVNEALDKMFADKANVSTQADPKALGMEEQIARLSAVVRKVESSVAQMQNMMRRGFAGGGGGGRMSFDNLPNRDNRNDKVLLEIFETNLELQRTINEPDTPASQAPSTSAGPAPAPATPESNDAADALESQSSEPKP